MTEVFKQLRKIRREKYLTQERLEEISGVPRFIISQTENGKNNPTLPTVSHWAQALGYELALEPKE